MAGILKVDKYQDFNGNDIMTSDGSGNLTLNNGALKMTPAFEATVGGSQSLSDAADTKIQFPTESFDTDSCYDNSTNYRFTPTISGKYFIYTGIRGGNATNSSLDVNSIWIRKNGSGSINFMRNDFPSNPPKGAFITTQSVVDFNGSTDYVEIYANYDMNSGTATINNGFFGGYKLIGV